MTKHYKRYEPYEKETICSVPNCNAQADFEVILYDYYSYNKDTFYEQDYTCPYLCENHMQENESKAKGERRPRGYVDYLYSNLQGAQGYTQTHEPFLLLIKELLFAFEQK